MLKDRIKRSREGNIRDKCPWFDTFEEIMGSSPTVDPVTIEDISLQSSKCTVPSPSDKGPATQPLLGTSSESSSSSSNRDTTASRPVATSSQI